MAFLPAIPAIGAALAKLGIGAKPVSMAAAYLGKGSLKPLAGAVKAAATPTAKTAATAGGKQAILGNAKRMAGNVFTDYLGGPVNRENLLTNFGLDAAFGVMSGMQEPGDLGDKLIRGTTTALAGGLGGVAGTVGVGKLTGQMPTGFLRQGTEVGGAMLGDHLGYAIADGMQRAKNDGMTAWEKESLRRQMEDLYASGGGDPFLYENGLG